MTTAIRYDQSLWIHPPTEDQKAAVDAVFAWFNRSPFPIFTLGGLAGTGKTTLIFTIVEAFLRGGLTAQVLTPTGKAAVVLSEKGLKNVRTVHSFIYQYSGRVVQKNKKGEVVRYRSGDAKRTPVFRRADDEQRRQQEGGRPDVLIVDEASMVDQTMIEDLSNTQIPVLYVGDYGQLPPVKSSSPLMERLDFKLETIMRQSKDNPIVQLAHFVREGGRPRDFKVAADDDRLTIKKGGLLTAVQAATNSTVDQIIVGTNKLRHAINERVRDNCHRSGLLANGDRIICLLNDRALQVTNGEIFTVVHNGTISETEFGLDDAGQPVKIPVALGARILRDGDSTPLPIDIFGGRFGDHFEFPDSVRDTLMVADYAYAITCHKAQGSEWDHVMVVDDPVGDSNRWRYTAVTRAANRLTMLIQ